MEGEPEVKKVKVDSACASEGCLFAYGNPLLDVSAETDTDILEKYGLEANNAILCEDKHKGIYDELSEKYKVDYVPGGATQNSVRVAQWMLGEPKQAMTFMGCIAKDKYGEILEKKTQEDGVKTLYMYHESQPTGTCAVVITGKNRSLVANLAAADHFTKEHLDKPEVWKYVEKAKYYYMAGFPLTVSPESMLSLAKHAANNNKVFTMNLSAPFLSIVFKQPMQDLLPYVDILFANETEAATFSEQFGLETKDVKEIAKKVANLDKENSQRKRIVVFTQGDQPTIVAQGDEIKEFPVISIKTEDIVDTNGAGDAFVGGYLAQLVKDAPLEECIRSAHYAANAVIQESGVTLAGKPDFK